MLFPLYYPPRVSDSLSIAELNSLILVPELYSMNILALAFPGVSENGGVVFFVNLLPCYEGSDSPPDPLFGSVPDVLPIFDQDPSILLN